MTNSYNNTDRALEVLIILKILLSFIPFIGYIAPTGTNLIVEACILFGIASRISLTNVFRIFLTSIPVLLILIVGYALSPGGIGYELYMIFKYILWAVIVYWIVFYDKYIYGRKLIKIIILVFILTGITTIIGNRIFPWASRYMAVGEYLNENPMMLSLYMRYNIGDFIFVYSSVLFIPFLVYFIKNPIIGRKLPIVLLSVIVLMTIATEYTTAVLLAFFSLSLLFFKRGLNARKIIVFSVMAAVVLLVADNMLSDLFYSLARNVSSESIASRFIDLGDAFSGTDLGEASDLNARMERNQISIETIKKNPFLGSAGVVTGAGGHSLILDYYALFGVFGLLLELIVFYSIYKKCVVPSRGTGLYGYVFFGFLMQILLAALNPQIMYNVFFLFYPLVIYLSKKEVMFKQYSKNIVQ